MPRKRKGVSTEGGCMKAKKKRVGKKLEKGPAVGV